MAAPYYQTESSSIQTEENGREDIGAKILTNGLAWSNPFTYVFICMVLLNSFEPVEAQYYLYWGETGSGKIRRSDLDGSNAVDVISGIARVEEIQVDVATGKIYWANNGDSKIQRANLDGTGTEDLLTGLSGPTGLAVDLTNSHLYWSSQSNPGLISRSNLEGGSREDLVTGVDNVKYPKSLALDLVNGHLFYRSNKPPNADYIIRRANLDGSSLQSNFITGQFNNGVEGIQVDPTGGKIYWAGRDSEKIYRANLDGSGIATIVSGLSDPMGVALDLINGKIYWADEGSDKVQRANLDGSGVEDILTGLNNPNGVLIAANGAPTATVQSVSGDEDASQSITLSGSDVEGSSLTYALASSPSNGSASLSGSTVTYTPAAGYNGSDSFTFTVSDGTTTLLPPPCRSMSLRSMMHRRRRHSR